MAKASHLRQINQRKVIRAMIRLSAASRTQLAREAGLSQPTVGRIVDELLDSSILSEVEVGDQPSPPSPPPSSSSDEAGQNGQPTPQLGRPSQALQLDRRRRRFLAIQVGVHTTRVAATPIAISYADEWQATFPTPQSPDDFADALKAVAGRVVPRGLQAAVVCLPGVVDERAGRVLLSPNLHWTERADFTDIVRRVTPARLLYIQEIRALALGQLAVEPQLQDFLLVDFGSGVGAAAVIGGKLYEGPLPLSGELGHTPVVGNNRPCSCGAVGCVETLVSRGGLLASAKQHGDPQTWPELVKHLQQQGSLPPWMTESLDAVATTIAGGLNLLGVRQVLFSGALNDMPSVTDHLCAAVRRGAMWGRFGEIQCRPAPRRRLVGMISLAIDHVLLSDVG
jgi:predicted NBD/HSP70 family sugar kinase